MSETLDARRPRQQMSFQIVGHSAGGTAGTRTTVQGTILPGDTATANRAALLMDALARMSRPASSTMLTRPDPLTASLLRPLRQVVTARSHTWLRRHGTPGT